MKTFALANLDLEWLTFSCQHKTLAPWLFINALTHSHSQEILAPICLVRES